MDGQPERFIHLIARSETVRAEMLLWSMGGEFRLTRKEVKHRLDTRRKQLVAKQDVNSRAAKSKRDSKHTLDNRPRNESACTCSDQDSWTIFVIQQRPGP